MYFLVKVSYESMTPSGSMKKVRESYVIDAVSFTEAEARTIGELQPKIDRELVVDAMSKVSFSGIIRTGRERWYKAKLNYITIDENTRQPFFNNGNVDIYSVESYADDAVDFSDLKIAGNALEHLFFSEAFT